MTSPRRFEQDLPALLADLYLAGTPDYRDDLVQQIAPRRQRPAWTFPERWLPMDIATPRSSGRRLPWRRSASSRSSACSSRRPWPSTSARSRRASGPVRAGSQRCRRVRRRRRRHPASSIRSRGEAVSSCRDPGTSRPTYSPDGIHARLSCARPPADADIDVSCALDGKRPIVITPEPSREVGYLGWSPDSDSDRDLGPAGRLEAMTRPRRSAPRRLSAEGQRLGLGLDDFNADIRTSIRPPTGAEILFLGSTPAGPALFVATPMATNAARSSIMTARRSRTLDLDVPAVVPGWDSHRVRP